MLTDLWLHLAEAWDCKDLADEYDALLEWVRSMIEKGVAFRQSVFAM